ncbi:hypothetical protein [Bacillus smithii]|uniref:hypothetical protein n=1 Tax=Bacillus smithii TaxID=1479 RepID=UPI002E1D6B08|nr:hypothetical protein [Bacillus smithii]MED4929141.1 hypothetical protein [Bacillus smithii]
MFWNYRVIKKKNEYDDPYYEVCEVYYNEENKPYMWTNDKHLLCCEELNDLKTVFQEIQKAFEKPVLEFIDDEHDLLREIDV